MSDKIANNDAYRLSDQIGYRLRLANQQHLEIFHHHLPNLTPTQFALLVTLNQFGEASQNELGRKISIDAATTNGVIERLLKKQLVQTQTDPNDKRRLRLTLTDAGRQTVEDCIPLALTISHDTMNSLTQKEGKRLLALLKKMQSDN